MQGLNWGWLSFNIGGFSKDDFAPALLVAQVVLSVALLGPRAVRNLFKVGWFGRRRRAATETKISTIQEQVDGVLRHIDVHVHPELYERARSFHGPVQRSRVVRDAWPLPGYVCAHLDDGETGSWW